MGLKESGLRGSLRNVSVGIDAIPDSVVSRYNADEESLGSQTTITDLIGDRHLQGSVEVADDGIGNQQVFEFRGNDFVENTDTYATEGDDIAVIFAYEIQESVNSNDYLFDADTDLNFGLQDDAGGEFQFSRDVGSEGQVNTGYAPDGDPHIGVVQAFADGTAELRIDGDAKGEITVGTEDLDGLLLSERGSRDDRGVDIDYNEVEVAVNFDSEDITDEEERLSDKLGIDLS